jgi:hypothetical protein
MTFRGGRRSARFARHAIALVLACALATQTLSAADQFMNVRLIINTGEKGEEQEVVLRFEEKTMLVVSRGGTNLKDFAYDRIEGAEYSYSKSPR